MEITLQELVNVAQSAPEGTEPAEAVAAFLLEKSNEEGGVNAQGLLDEALAKFNDTLDGGAESEAEVAALEVLAKVVEGSRAEIARRDVEAATRADRLAELAKTVNPPEGDGDEGDKDADAKGADADAADADKGDGGDSAVVPEGDAADVDADAAGAALVASGARKVRVDLASLRRTREPAPSKPTMSIVASAGIPGYNVGQSLVGKSGGFEGVAKAANEVIGAFPLGQKGIGPIRGNIARMAIEFPPELTITDAGNDMRVLDYAGDQSRLRGTKSLVAAGGWCSPSETLYELAGQLSSASAGILDLPDISTPRGGVRFTEGPDFRTIYGATGFVQTEAQAIAGTAKPFYRVPCTDFEDHRVDVIGFGLISGILNNDAYPELTERVVAETLVAHSHRVNFETLKRMEALSEPVASTDLGAAAETQILNLLELQIVDYRYGYRAPETLILSFVLPIFVKAQMRSSLALRNGVPFETVTDAQIDGWFAARGARVQWVYDWQDAYSGDATGFGAETPKVSWPTSVKGMLYADGTFIRARGEVITLDSIYDSTNIKVNDFVRLFTEEKIMVARRQWHSRLLTIPLATNGVTSAPRELTAQGAVAPVTP